MPRGRNLPPLLAQASSRAGEGASLLFSRLDATSARHHYGAEVLVRLAEHLRAGAWNSDIAELVARAEGIEKQLDTGSAPSSAAKG
ncbi:MAG: hypothetical protein ACLQUY_24205 [Ktedonobacterales bacterium]